MVRVVVVLLLLFTNGCTRTPLPTHPGAGPSSEVPRNETVTAAVRPPAHKLTEGEVLYLRQCATCHGASARGDGPMAAELEIRPQNLRRADLFTNNTEEALIAKILHGKSLPVPLHPLDTSSRELDIEAIAKHIRRLPTLPWDEVEHGEEVYDSLCLSCHGLYGRGDGPLVRTLEAPPRDLATPPYQQEVTDQALFQIISEGKGAMPGTADVLSVEDRRAVVQFVRLLSPGFEAYDRYCVGCHGNKGEPADPQVMQWLRQDPGWEPPPAFDAEFFRSRTEEQIRTGIRHMLDLKRMVMPHFAGDLTAEQVRQILGYVRSLPPET
ncbi:MAG: c-type cytochrome [Candidatus Binatia bacterium]